MVNLSDMLGEGPDIPIKGITVDSRRVASGDLFVALPGHHTHGAVFAPGAVLAGAAAIVTDEVGAGLCVGVDAPVVVVPNPRASLGAWCRTFFGTHNLGVQLVGITGTNGKTTVAHFVEAACNDAGHPAGIIGTLGVRFANVELSGERTTPEAPDVHRTLAEMAKHGVQVAVFEVSSHALCEHRVDGLIFDVVGFTNLSQDHLDYHGTMERYYAAKASLFTPERARRGIVGIDDAWGRRLARETTIPIQTWSCLDPSADWFGVASERGLVVRGPDGATTEAHLAMPVPTNLANATCAIALVRTLGIEQVGNALSQVRVPGRMERFVSTDGVTAIVDYAHTPVAIEAVVTAMRGGGRVIVVLGAGGDRDRDKRAAMGGAASLADYLIVTDDNPRSEDPAVIRAGLIAGIRDCPYTEVPDRLTAIEDAISDARPGDTVLVLGKGHEQGQEIGGVITPFDDRAIVRAAIERRAGA